MRVIYPLILSSIPRNGVFSILLEQNPSWLWRSPLSLLCIYSFYFPVPLPYRGSSLALESICFAIDIIWFAAPGVKLGVLYWSLDREAYEYFCFWTDFIVADIYLTCEKFSLIFCEAQWRHSVKTRLYNTPPPYFILWNAVTSLGENKVI